MGTQLAGKNIAGTARYGTAFIEGGYHSLSPQEQEEWHRFAGEHTIVLSGEGKGPGVVVDPRECEIIDGEVSLVPSVIDLTHND